MRYKVGQVVVCQAYPEEGSYEVKPVLGCVVEVGSGKGIMRLYRVEWSDCEEDWYTEEMLSDYVKQAKFCLKDLPSSNT